MQTSRLYTKALCGEEEMGGKRKVDLSPVQGPALGRGMRALTCTCIGTKVPGGHSCATHIAATRNGF